MTREEDLVVRRVLDGDTNSFELLVRKYQMPIYNLMLRVTSSPDTASDLAQDTFVAAFEKLDTFRLGNRFFPWLYGIGYNKARDWLRREKRWGFKVEIDNLMDHPDLTVQAFDTSLEAQRIDDALKQVPLDYGETLILRFREGLSMKEIATAMDISESGAKMRVHRGLKMLRDILCEGDTHEPERHPGNPSG